MLGGRRRALREQNGGFQNSERTACVAIALDGEDGHRRSVNRDALAPESVVAAVDQGALEDRS